MRTTAGIDLQCTRHLRDTSHRRTGRRTRIRGKPDRAGTGRWNCNSLCTSWNRRKSAPPDSRRWCNPWEHIGRFRCPARAKTTIRSHSRSRRVECTRGRKRLRSNPSCSDNDQRQCRCSCCLWSSHTSPARQETTSDQSRRSRKVCPTTGNRTWRSRPCRRRDRPCPRRRSSPLLQHAEARPGRRPRCIDRYASGLPGSTSNSWGPGRACCEIVDLHAIADKEHFPRARQ